VPLRLADFAAAPHGRGTAFAPCRSRRVAAGAFVAVVAAHAALLLTAADPVPPRYALAAVRPMSARLIAAESPNAPSRPVTRPAPQPPRAATPPPAPAAPPAPAPERPAQAAAPGSADADQAAVIPPRFDADYLDNPAPKYPPISRRLGEQGRVLVRVQVDPAGQPVRVELDQSSRYPRLDGAALEAVRHWRFAPARRGERPVSAWVLVPVVFSLRS
jgi:protein TonB